MEQDPLFGFWELYPVFFAAKGYSSFKVAFCPVYCGVHSFEEGISKNEIVFCYVHDKEQMTAGAFLVLDHQFYRLCNCAKLVCCPVNVLNILEFQEGFGGDLMLMHKFWTNETFCCFTVQ